MVASVGPIEMPEGEVVILGEVRPGQYVRPGASSLHITVLNIPESNLFFTLIALPGHHPPALQYTNEMRDIKSALFVNFVRVTEGNTGRLENLVPGTYTIQATSWPMQSGRTIQQWGPEVYAITRVITIDRFGQEIATTLDFADRPPRP